MEYLKSCGSCSRARLDRVVRKPVGLASLLASLSVKSEVLSLSDVEPDWGDRKLLKFCECIRSPRLGYQKFCVLFMYIVISNH